MAIPKILHCVWLGGKPLPPPARRCIRSWKALLPDWELRIWTEDNFDVSENPYCRQAYTAKQYAFASDYIRLAVLHRYGGVYLDTDVELLRPFTEEMLACRGFSGYETPHTLPTGVMGAEAGHPFIAHLLRHYDGAAFLRPDGSYDRTPNIQIITALAKERGFVPDGTKQAVMDFTLFPQTVFCPLSHDGSGSCFSPDTCAIHHFAASWCDRTTRFAARWQRRGKARWERLLGRRLSDLLYRVVYHLLRAADRLTEKGRVRA